jgi:predicted phage-related endonuclease
MYLDGYSPEQIIHAAHRKIRQEYEAREVARRAELIAGHYIVRYTFVLSNRFDSTSFKKVLPDLYKAYTKQVSSRRFTISA